MTLHHIRCLSIPGITFLRPGGIKTSLLKKTGKKECKQPRTIKEHSGKVIAVCVKLVSGGIRAIAKGDHDKVMEMFDIDPNNVVAAGWELDNGNYVWR